MTQWIKNGLLGYDATDVSYFPWSDIGNSVAACVNKKDAVQKYIVAPPRSLINAGIKWSLFDRALADALLYAGKFGDAMQRGVAESLCRIINKNFSEDESCAWPYPYQAVPSRHYVFVTHSLGSRMLYDTILRLEGAVKQNENSADEYFFGPNYISMAKNYIGPMIRDTSAIYMMANQIPMLGLTRVTSDVTEAGLRDDWLHQLAQGINPLNVEEGITASTPSSKARKYDPLLSVMTSHSGDDESGSQLNVLHVISVNDSNDLLTWHLPSWYASKDEFAKLRVEPKVVFVKNAPSILGIFENPLKAHSGYFENLDVWKLMFCGAQDGALRSCQ